MFKLVKPQISEQRMTVRLLEPDMQKLIQLSKKTGITRGVLCRIAVQKMLEELEKQEQEESEPLAA